MACYNGGRGKETGASSLNVFAITCLTCGGRELTNHEHLYNEELGARILDVNSVIF